MTIGRSSSPGRSASTRLIAFSPPHDAPMHTRSYIRALLTDLPVELLVRVELLVTGLVRAEADRLLVAQPEHAERDEALEEEPVDALLQCPVEVDHHIAADDDVELVERVIRDEVVLGEDDILDQRALKLRAVVLGNVVLRERPLPARLDVVLRVLAHLVERKHARTRAFEDGFVDVRRVDASTVVDLLLLEENGERVDLLAGGAASHPDPGERIRAESGNDLLPECNVEGRVAKHRGHVDRKVEQEALHAGGVVQEPVLQRRDRLQPFGEHTAPDAASQRGRGVLAEVEAVMAEDSLEQQGELDFFEVVVNRRVLARTRRLPGRTNRGHASTCTTRLASAKAAGRCRPAS